MRVLELPSHSLEQFKILKKGRRNPKNPTISISTSFREWGRDACSGLGMGELDVSKPNANPIGIVDPFASLPLLYFLPASVKALAGAVSVSDPDDLEAIHEFLKSKVSNISKHLPVQSQETVDSTKEAIKGATARQPLIEMDMNNLNTKQCTKHTMAEGKENDYDMQKRRPGFGRKRARFSLKPISQDIVVMSGRASLDQLEDPEEFFAAYERQENAEKELKRLRGEILVDQISSHCLSEARTRRQGILGRTATYRHSYTEIAVNVPKDTSSVGNSEAENNFVSSTMNDCNLSRNTSVIVHGDGLNLGILKENEMGTAISPALENNDDGLLSSLLDACHNPDEVHTFNLLQKSLKVEEIDMHKIQLPKFNRFSVHDILAPQSSTSRADIRTESNILNFSSQMWNSKISEETPKSSRTVSENICSPLTSPTPPKSPFAAISGLCRHKSQTKGGPFDLPLMFNLGKESSFAIPFELEVPSHPGGVPQEDRLAFVDDSASKDVDKNGSIFSGSLHSKWLVKDTMRNRWHSVNKGVDGLTGVDGRGQEKNLIVGSSNRIQSTSVLQLPGQEEDNIDKILADIETVGVACPSDHVAGKSPNPGNSTTIQLTSGGEDNIDKNSSDIETVGIVCRSDQVAGKTSNSGNSIGVQLVSGGNIQRPTLEKCKSVNGYGDVPNDELTCSDGADVGETSNGSDKDVNPQTGVFKICMSDKNSNPGNCTRIWSTSGGEIQHAAMEECNVVDNCNYMEMPRDGFSCSAGGDSGKSSNGYDKGVNPQIGVSSGCLADNVESAMDPAAIAHEVLVGDKGQTSDVVGACSPQGQNLEEITVSSESQHERNQVPSKTLARKRSKNRTADHRKSLVGAGTAWKSGVRRSTRIRSRPLEYWRGERFLYGRVHNSLVTVIGVKCSSPAVNGKKGTSLKVKSFVSKEYSHLLDLAGSH